MNPLLLRYLPHLIGAIALVAIGFVVNGWRNDSHELALIEPLYDEMRTALADENQRVLDLEVVDAEKAAALIAKGAEEQAADRVVENAWERAPALETTDEVTDPVRLSFAWGVCFAAVAGGDAGDREACEAAGRDGPLSAGGGDGSL